MGFELEKQIRERDRALRAKILSTLRLAEMTGPLGGLSGDSLRICVDGAMTSVRTFESEEHALRLIRELVAGKLIEETPIQRRRLQPGLAGWFYKITPDGTAMSLMNDAPGMLDESE
jgi:hypothetical protein